MHLAKVTTNKLRYIVFCFILSLHLILHDFLLPLSSLFCVAQLKFEIKHNIGMFKSFETYFMDHIKVIFSSIDL
jgi:hypothetical protein